MIIEYGLKLQNRFAKNNLRILYIFCKDRTGRPFLNREYKTKQKVICTNEFTFNNIDFDNKICIPKYEPSIAKEITNFKPDIIISDTMFFNMRESLRGRVSAFINHGILHKNSTTKMLFNNNEQNINLYNYFFLGTDRCAKLFYACSNKGGGKIFSFGLPQFDLCAKSQEKIEEKTIIFFVSVELQHQMWYFKRVLKQLRKLDTSYKVLIKPKVGLTRAKICRNKWAIKENFKFVDARDDSYELMSKSHVIISNSISTVCVEAALCKTPYVEIAKEMDDFWGGRKTGAILYSNDINDTCKLIDVAFKNKMENNQDSFLKSLNIDTKNSITDRVMFELVSRVK